MNIKRLIIGIGLSMCWGSIYPQQPAMVSGDVTLTVNQTEDGSFYLSYQAYGETLNGTPDTNPAIFIDTNKEFYFKYTHVTSDGQTLVAQAEVTASPSSVVFAITDTYYSKGNGEFELQRNISVKELGDKPYTAGFYSSFGLQTSTENILDNEYFIPTVMYRGNFLPEGNIPSGLPQSDDTDFFYREDRITLPVVMSRRKSDGLTTTVIHKDSKCTTVLNDCRGVIVDENYQFGGVGFAKRRDGKVTTLVTFPGNDTRRDGMGERRHPIDTRFDRHAYTVYYKISKTDSYAQAVDTAWNLSFALYNPQIYEEQLPQAYTGIMETVNHYYMEPPGEVKAPGFPWSVNLTDFSLIKDTYELGFVGAQPVAGYALFREGVETENEEYKKRGNQVLNFWALKSLSDLGLPKSRFAALNGTWDSWAYTSIRQACNGMAGLLNAWCFAQRNGINRPAWISACQQFGDFLVENQNEDGSFYLEYQPFQVVNGKHPAGNQNKFTTTCSLRYLVELYIATGDERYRETALRAAEYCYENIHKKYIYAACVIDNPQTIDSESGQQALNGFLAVYDLTKEAKWLEAAEQAAIYTASWTYMYEVPVEIDQTAETDWPKDRSIVGQHLIAIGHSAADLGFAWSSFVYYRLYLLTGKEVYLHIARVSAHNTKQSMNLRGELYSGQPEGLQQEAFTVRTSNNPRRTNSVMQALTWNFAAHLDPMIRFKDAFGTCDLEAVEKMPKSEVLEMNERYSHYQSSDYGQELSVLDLHGKADVRTEDSMLVVKNVTLEKVELVDLSGIVYPLQSCCSAGEYTCDLSQMKRGIYILNLYCTDGNVIVCKIRI